jgi:hypothetical protein
MCTAPLAVRPTGRQGWRGSDLMNMNRTAACLALVVGSSIPAARADSVFQFAPQLITAPDSRGFSNATGGSGSLATGSVVSQSGITYNFLDTWQFTLAAGAHVGAFVGSLNFTDASGLVTQGIDHLQLRLLDGNGQIVSGGAWQTIGVGPNAQQQFSVIAPASFAAGAYALQIRGSLEGSASAYAGTLQAVQPVPLPATLPLLAGGLALLSMRLRRRRA